MTVCATITQMQMVMGSVITAMTMESRYSQATTQEAVMAQVHIIADMDITAAVIVEEADITEDIAKNQHKAKSTNFARNRKRQDSIRRTKCSAS